MKKEYVAPKKVTEEIKKAHSGACGLFHLCGELVRSTK